MLFKTNKKWNLFRLHGVKRSGTCFFERRMFFENWRVKTFIIQKITRCNFYIQSLRPFFKIKIWHVVKILFQNLTCCFFSKIKIWCVVFFHFTVRLLYRLFKFPLNYHMCYQHQRTTGWKMTTTWNKKFLMSVWHMFVSHLVLFFFAYCVLYSNWFLDGCDDFSICTTSWFIQISLEFRR